MAKVKVEIDLEKTAKKLLNEKQIFERVAKYSINRIKKVTRGGMSMESGKQKKLPPLKESTIARREILALLNSGIHKDFSPEVSNITMTGQLLNSLIFKLKKRLKSMGFEIEIKPDKSKKRRRLKGLRGKPLETPNNEEIYADLVSRGFGFLGMDKQGQKDITDIFRNHIRRELRRLRQNR